MEEEQHKRPQRPNEHLRRERDLRGWSQQVLAEKVGTTESVVSMWEGGQHKPNRYFQSQLCELFGKNAEALGFMDASEGAELEKKPLSVTRLRETIHYLGKSVEQVAKDLNLGRRTLYNYVYGKVVVPEELRPGFATYLGCTQEYLFPHPSQWLLDVIKDDQEFSREMNTHPRAIQQESMVHQSMMEVVPLSSEATSTLPPEHISPASLPSIKEHEIQYPRRNLVQHLLTTMGSAFFPGTLLLDLEILERLSSALHHSSLDEATFTHLTRVTETRRYEFVHSDGRTWQELFQELSGHLRVITQLIERNIQHNALYTLAGETALLLGDILFNAGENTAADHYYQSALDVCQENHLLQAVILGRKALIPIYGRFPEKALSTIDEAQQTIPSTAADSIVAWLWAIKAEAHAVVGDTDACLRALSLSEHFLERGRSGAISLHFQPEIAYATFSSTKLSGYRGTCLLHLKRTEAAQEILHQHLAAVEKEAHVHHQSIALIDLAMSCVQQASIRNASSYALRALTCLEHTQSRRVFQRMLKLRQALHPWVNTTSVKHLDEQLSCVADGFLRGVS